MKRVLKNERSIHPVVLRLRAIRIEQKRSVEWVSRRIGWNSHAIGKWERGQRSPNLWAVSDYAAALGYEFIIREGAQAMVVSFPSKQKMMAGR